MSHTTSDPSEADLFTHADDDRELEMAIATLRVAVLVPCLNEEHAIGAVVAGFARALPTAQIFVYDNGSSDDTVARAREAGATVRFEPRRGKGNVVRRMFSDIDADIYVLVDGDGTYDASSAPRMVRRLVSDHLDMVIGARIVGGGDEAAYRRGHATGNYVFTKTVRMLFSGQFTDVLSGYRVLSRRFVKSLPMFSSGFEMEAELCAHADRLHVATAEVATPYTSRHQDSSSKLRTVPDGLRILAAIVRLIEETRPLQFFAGVFALLTIVAFVLGIPVVDEYARTGRVPRFPTAILAVAIQIIGFLALLAGVILRSVARTRDEIRQMMYLQMASDHCEPVRPPNPRSIQ